VVRVTAVKRPLTTVSSGLPIMPMAFLVIISPPEYLRRKPSFTWTVSAQVFFRVSVHAPPVLTSSRSFLEKGRDALGSFTAATTVRQMGFTFVTSHLPVLFTLSSPSPFPPSLGTRDVSFHLVEGDSLPLRPFSACSRLRARLT